MSDDDKVDVQNINHPGHTSSVNGPKYRAMRIAYLKVLPATPPGATQRELIDRVKSHLPEALFPGGKTSGWWVKTVQLDLEAKGMVARAMTKPLRWYRA